MLKRLPTALACALAAAGVTVGVAVAGDGYDHSHAQHQQPQPAKPKPAKKWAQFKQMSPSRLSQSAYLTGFAEVDPATGEPDAGDPDGKGSATFLQVDEDTFCFGVVVKGIGVPTLMHIHKAVAGQNGDVVIPFDAAELPKGADGNASGDRATVSACKTLTDEAQLAALQRIRKNPQGYYLNIHTDRFKAGAIRGQLAPVWYDNED